MLQINQVFDAWFNKGFKGPKCKTLLKLASSRIKLLRNKRATQIKQLRRELAQLLETGQESTAHIRVEHIIREQNIMEAYDTLELYSELLIVRMPIMESQRECPLDLKEAVTTLIFAAPRASDLPELFEVQNMLSFKYGREFVESAAELRPNCGVNRLVIENLSARAPMAAVKLDLMKEITEEHHIEWDSTNTELEFSKAPEDLLGGSNHFTENWPNHFIGPIQMSPIPCFKDDIYPQQLRSGFSEESALSSPPKAKLSTHLDSSDSIEEPRFVSFIVPPQKCVTESLSGRFYSPPRESSITQQSGLLEETLLQRSHSRTKSEGSMNLQDIIEAAEAAAESAEKAARAARAAAELVRSRISPRLSKSIPQEAMPHITSEMDPVAQALKSQGNALTPDSYDWTLGQREQDVDGVLQNESIKDMSVHLTPDSYDWTQEYTGMKQEDDDPVSFYERVENKSPNVMDRHFTRGNYDWTQEYSGRKQEETVERKGLERRSAFDMYGDDGYLPGEARSLHHEYSMKEGTLLNSSAGVEHEHGGHQAFHDAPRFDGAETVSYPEPFQRQSSLEDDPYYSYPNLFTKSTAGGADR